MVLNKIVKNNKEIKLPKQIIIPDNIGKCKESDIYFTIFEAIIDAWNEDLKEKNKNEGNN